MDKYDNKSKGVALGLNNVQKAQVRREYANSALAGMLAHSTRYRPIDKNEHWYVAIAKEAFAIADAMLEAE